MFNCLNIIIQKESNYFFLTIRAEANSGGKLGLFLVLVDNLR
jgi:hypothetical protein